MSTVLLVSAATLGLMGLFAAAYAFSRRVDNYGTVDVVWSYAFALVAGWYAIGGAGDPLRRAVVAGMVVVWSLRLGTHLARRVARHHPVEDGRYQQLRRDWAGNFAPKMFGFFQLQAVSVVLLAVPFALSVQNPASPCGWLRSSVRRWPITS
jgi:steroid 5-alpha reductase family enzyme